MKKLTMFYLETCPFCKKAFNWMEELKAENPAYKDIEVHLVEETKEKEIAEQHDYYFVPTYYLGDEKIHEGIATKEKIKAVFDKTLNS